MTPWAETNLPEGFTVFGFPAPHQRRLQMTNGLGRLNRELLRRTKVVGIFPNEAACLRLVSAIAVATSDERAICHAYLTFTTA